MKKKEWENEKNQFILKKEQWETEKKQWYNERIYFETSKKQWECGKQTILQQRQVELELAHLKLQELTHGLEEAQKLAAASNIPIANHTTPPFEASVASTDSTIQNSPTLKYTNVMVPVIIEPVTDLCSNIDETVVNTSKDSDEYYLTADNPHKRRKTE